MGTMYALAGHIILWTLLPQFQVHFAPTCQGESDFLLQVMVVPRFHMHRS